MAYQPGQQFGRYRIIRPLESGGITTTYLAQDTRRRREVVLALVLPDAQHITREVATRLARLDNPNIAHLLDFGEVDRSSFIVTEYVQGGNLRQRHPHGSVVPLQEAVSYVRQVASALQTVHNSGLIHRDVKPENMLLDGKQRVLLTDFGLTILVSSQKEDVAGTPSYMAPEQIQGLATPASDQYALGVVLYEWLTGQRPFQGSTIELLQKHLYEPVPPMPRTLNIPVEVEAAIQKALAKRPEDRYLRVLDFAEALKPASLTDTSFLGPAPGSARSAGAFEALPFTQPSQRYQPPPPWIPPGSSSTIGDESEEEADPVVRAEQGQPPLPRKRHGRIPPGSSSTIGDESEEEEETKDQPTKLSLFALARTFLEKDEIAHVGKTYTLEVGIGNRGLDPYSNVPFTITVQDLTQPIHFHVLFHASSNIEALDHPFQALSYDPGSRGAQFINWHFRLRESGPSEIVVNFYRERQWLSMVRLEFVGVGLALLPSL